MRGLLIGLVALGCAQHERPAPKTVEPGALTAQVAQRAGFLLDQLEQSREREAVCQAGVKAEQARTATASSETDAERARVAVLESEIARLQSELDQAHDLAAQRGRQIVASFDRCGADAQLAQKATAERDACYLELARHTGVAPLSASR